MRFTPSPAANRTLSVLPLLSVLLLPALLVLAVVCLSLSREEEIVRLPTGTLPRPPLVRETPLIAVRLSRQGAVVLAGQPVAEGVLVAAWRRERGALRLLGFEPSQATVVVHADPDVPIDKVQSLIEAAQAAGFTQCVLRPAEPLKSSSVIPGQNAILGPGAGTGPVPTQVSRLTPANHTALEGPKP
jgi:biopolymer transport protein ExbD